MEGANQFVSWRHIIEYTDFALAPINSITDNSTIADWYNALNTTIDTVMNNPTFSISQEVYNTVVGDLDVFLPDSNVTDDAATEAYQDIAIQVLKIIFNGYGFEPPETAGEENEKPEEALKRYFAVFNLIFEYFFISAGLVLIFISIFTWLSRGNKRLSGLHYVSIVSNFALGVGLALLTTMVLTNAADNLGESAWTLPLLVFVLFIAMVLNHLPRYLMRTDEKYEDEEM
jgi:hypothetical protein